MSGLEVTIKMSPELEPLIRRLRDDKDAGMSAAMRFLVEEFAAHAVKEAPVKTGNLADSITTDVTDSGRTGIVKATAAYAVFVHEGTRPHVIRAKNKRGLWWPGAAHPFRAVRHPGTKPNPFFLEAASKVDHESVYEAGLRNYLTQRGW